MLVRSTPIVSDQPDKRKQPPGNTLRLHTIENCFEVFRYNKRLNDDARVSAHNRYGKMSDSDLRKVYSSIRDLYELKHTVKTPFLGTVVGGAFTETGESITNEDRIRGLEIKHWTVWWPIMIDGTIFMTTLFNMMYEQTGDYEALIITDDDAGILTKENEGQ